MVTKEDIERLQENLKAAIMRDDWNMCDLLVKQISEASGQLRQPTQRAVDAATPCPYCKRVHDNRLACPEYAATTPHR